MNSFSTVMFAYNDCTGAKKLLLCSLSIFYNEPVRYHHGYSSDLKPGCSLSSLTPLPFDFTFHYVLQQCIYLGPLISCPKYSSYYCYHKIWNVYFFAWKVQSMYVQTGKLQIQESTLPPTIQHKRFLLNGLCTQTLYSVSIDYTDKGTGQRKQI